MSIYLPFTYFIFHLPTGFKYYGAKFSKGCHPSDLWTKYFTSSKKVKQLIEEYGKDSFVYEIRKTFTNKDDCLKWENKVLERMHVLEKDDWLNNHIGGHRFRNNGHNNYSPEARAKMSAANKGKIPWNKGRVNVYSQECLQRIREGRRKSQSYRNDSYRMELLEKWYKFTSPSNEIFIVKGQTKFCREHGLNQGNMTSVVRGRYKQCLGWKCKDYDIDIDTLDPLIIY